MTIKDLFMSKRGQICSVTYERPLKTRKSAGDIKVTKKVEGLLCRAGIEYDNQAAVQEKRETGELPPENAGLPWGEWDQYPYTIKHKGETYFRFSTLNNPTSSHKTTYLHYLDPEHPIEISEDDAKEMCLASEFYEKSLDVFTLKEPNIIELK